MKRLFLAFCLLVAGSPLRLPAAEEPSEVQQLIPWLLSEERRLDDIPFPEVIRAATGRKVLPVDREDAVTRNILEGIGKALDAVLEEMNTTGKRSEGRINEQSALFEEAIRKQLNKIDGFNCEVPRTAAGRIQRSGYPDLRLLDRRTGRVFYLDPKLYAKGSRDGTFRTFYYEPKRSTNKVLDDAIHLCIGIEHSTGSDGARRFERWELIDLSGFRVRLKAEFEAGNRELYRPEAVVGRGP